MAKKILLWLIALALIGGCAKKEEKEHKQPTLPSVGDSADNGGMLRFTVEGKAMRDRFVVAQFTPRGDLFTEDNLQIYNYDIDSAKYPRLLISVNTSESDLKKWQGKILTAEDVAFTVSDRSAPLTSHGEIKITRVNDQFVEGQFNGNLLSEGNGKSFEIRGEFKAVLRWNV